MNKPELAALLDQAFALKKYPLARLISLFENRSALAAEQRVTVLELIAERSNSATPGTIVGFTGTPGAGKSTLIGAVCEQLIRDNTDKSIAVLAVDPSSQISKGAILGDRTRVHFPLNDPRVFFRSQASNLEYGGVSMATFQACRILRYLFDLVVIETVGIGQSEIDIQRLADHSLLVMQPLAGDQIQFMKAGIMEIPDAFVVNKCDEDTAARQSLQMLKASLRLGKVIDHEQPVPPIFTTSATERRGIRELVDYLAALTGSATTFPATEEYYFQRWLTDEFGRRGAKKFAADGSDDSAVFEHQQKHADQLLSYEKES